MPVQSPPQAAGGGRSSAPPEGKPGPMPLCTQSLLNSTAVNALTFHELVCLFHPGIPRHTLSHTPSTVTNTAQVW